MKEDTAMNLREITITEETPTTITNETECKWADCLLENVLTTLKNNKDIHNNEVKDSIKDYYSANIIYAGDEDIDCEGEYYFAARVNGFVLHIDIMKSFQTDENTKCICYELCNLDQVTFAMDVITQGYCVIDTEKCKVIDSL